ncbi:MAG: alanine dehydrogenase, partial [Lysobacterales bacterium]
MRLKATYILTAKHIKSLKDEKEIIREVEKAFVAYAQDKAQMPSKVYLDLKEHNGDFRAMPAYLPHTKSASLKWVNVHPNNKALPAVMGTIILSDPKTGFPQSIMDGTLITKWRTAAASAVATKYLAPKKSSVLSIIGCGAQALSQVHFINCVMNVKKVCLWDIDIKQAKILCAQLRKSFDEVIVCETA